MLAGYWLAIFSGWVKGPLVDGCDNAFVDSVTQTTGHFDVGDLACRVDDDVEDDVAFGAVRERG